MKMICPLNYFKPLSGNKYRILWYIPILLSPYIWPWLMFICALIIGILIIGISQGYIEFLKQSNKNNAKNTKDVPLKNKKLPKPIIIIFSALVIFTVITLGVYTFYENVLSLTFENTTILSRLFLVRIIIGILWTHLIEAFCLAIILMKNYKFFNDKIFKE